MDRITQKDLNILVDQINALTDSPMTKRAESNTGHFFIEYSLGGQMLCRIRGVAEPDETISFGGLITKQQLHNQLNMFITGIKL